MRREIKIVIPVFEDEADKVERILDSYGILHARQCPDEPEPSVSAAAAGSTAPRWRGEDLEMWRQRWLASTPTKIEAVWLPALMEEEHYEGAAIARDTAAFLRQCGVP